MAQDDFIKKWLDLPNRDPDVLSEHTIENDHWDRRYVDQMLETIDDFLINHEAFDKKIETGSPMWYDLYWLLYKYEPQSLPSGQMKPSHLLNFLVGEELISMQDYRKLKFFSEGNDMAAAMACIDMRETLEQLFDKLKQLRDKLKDVMEQMRQLGAMDQEQHDLDEMVEAWKNGMNPDLPDPDSEEGQDQAKEFENQQEQLKLNMQGLERQLKDIDLQQEIDLARAQISGFLDDVVEEAADNAQTLHSQQDLWGGGAGTLMRMPADERMKLARRMQNKRFQRLLDLIGPMRRIMEEAQMRRVDHARDEIYRITMGDDLARILPSQLALLNDEDAELDFLRKFAEKSLPQYQMRGKEKVGKGEIIACLDNSGSMMGEKEMWGKAVAICALHLSRKQKRGFYGIHFGAAREIATFDFGVGVEVSPHQVVDFAEFFFNGGTDFMRPLSLAVDRLTSEYEATGKVKGDIMFITDGLCAVDPGWLEQFKEAQKLLEFRVYGFLIGGFGKDSEPLKTICDEKIWTIQDLLDPSDTKGMFGAI